MRFSTCRPGKPMEIYFKTIFGIGNNVGETYKRAEFGWDRLTRALHIVVKYHGFVTFVPPFFIFFRFLNSPTVATLDRFARLIAQMTCSVPCTCHFGVWSLRTHLRGFPAQKTPKFRPVFGLPICSGNRFTIRAFESKVPSNVKITSHKLDFWMGVTNKWVLRFRPRTQLSY